MGKTGKSQKIPLFLPIHPPQGVTGADLWWEGLGWCPVDPSSVNPSGVEPSAPLAVDLWEGSGRIPPGPAGPLGGFIPQNRGSNSSRQDGGLTGGQWNLPSPQCLQLRLQPLENHGKTGIRARQRGPEAEGYGEIPGIMGIPWPPGSVQEPWPCPHGVWPPALPSAAPEAAPRAPALSWDPGRDPGRDRGLGGAVEEQGAVLGAQGSRGVAAQGSPHPSPEPPGAESRPHRSASRSGRIPASAPGSEGKGEWGETVKIWRNGVKWGQSWEEWDKTGICNQKMG